MRKDCKITVFTALALAYALQVALGVGSGYCKGDLWPHLWFPFFHANIFHLAANILTLAMLRCEVRDILPAYAVAVIASFFAVASVPTMGFSGVLYVLIGMQTGIFRGRVTLPKVWFFAFLLAGLFLPRVNGLLHIVCFASGALIQLYRRLSYDYARAGR